MKKMICLLLLTATLALVFGACNLLAPRDPIDPAEFRGAVEAAGFEVWDAFDAAFCESDCEPGTLCENCESLYEGTYQALFAVGAAYRFELYEFIDMRAAISSYNRLKADIESWRTGRTSSRASSFANHSRFEMTSGGIYSQVYRVDNVLIFVTADVEHRDEIREIMNQF